MIKSKSFAVALMTLSLTAITAVSATFAWYQIQVNASASYDGTSVGNSTKFQIGLRSAAVLNNSEEYGLILDETRPGIYWSNGDLDNATLNYYLMTNGYATTALTPITSGIYSAGLPFSLINSPQYLTEFVASPALTSSYVKINFVFRVTKLSGEEFNIGDVYLKDFAISGNGSIQNATRVYFSSNSFVGLLNPNSIIDGATAVGGILDLNSDGYFDYNTSTDNFGNVIQEEFVYGNYGSVNYAANETTGTGQKTFTGSCFNAFHKDGVHAATFTASSASYLGTSSMVDNQTVLTSINANTSVADLTMTLYVEGWDSSSSDTTNGQRFSLVMNFESD